MFEKQSLIDQNNRNKYVFKVSVDATKKEVKDAVEDLFQVNVKEVSILNVKGKTKRTAKGYSRKKNWKKAYVSVEQGQEIDFMVVE